jgi:hypothetical protein
MKTKQPAFLGLPSRIADRINTSGDCWLWTGYVESNGYGRVPFDGRSRWAHRVVYQLLVGEIPQGLELDHLCRNPRCVNPSHLEPVTHAENMRRSPIGAPQFHRTKTHCPQGHPYAGDNLVLFRGMRYCRECQRRHKAAYKAKRRAERCQ